MRFFKDIRATAIVELALVMPLLIFLIIFSTDVLLAILVRTQVQNAARAAGEFAINFGYDENGITLATQNSISNGQNIVTNYLIPLSSITVSFLDPSDVSLGSATYGHKPFCACVGNTFNSSTPVSAISSLVGPSCGNGTAANYCPGSTSTNPVYPVPMAKIKVSVSYRPIFGWLWNYAVNGVFSNSTSVMVVTF